MSLGSYLRERTLRKEFLLEGERWHDRIERFGRPLDAILAAFMNEPAHEAPIFILGPHRSGTTFFVKCLQRHHQVCAFDQAVNYFPQAFITAGIYFRAIGATKATDFLERYDARHDRWIRTWKNHGYTYTEGNSIWRRLGLSGEWASPEERQWALRYYPRLVSRLRASTGRSVFVNKCPTNAMRMPQLLEMFPDARFIHVERDPRGVINSIVNVHRSLGSWWGPMPMPASELEGLTIYEKATKQWLAMTDAALKGMAPLPPERRATVRYEHFMQGIDQGLASIALRFEMEPFREPVRMEVRHERNAGWRTEVPADEVARIERLIVDAGYGHMMAEA